MFTYTFCDKHKCDEFNRVYKNGVKIDKRDEIYH